MLIRQFCCSIESTDNYSHKTRINYEKNEYYEGSIKNGIRNGKGWYYYLNKDFYYGNWVDDEKHGYGQFYYHRGDLYRGYWKKGVKHGFGEYFYNNGDRYKGYWLNNEKHGKGIYYYNDFCEYRGIFVHNHKHGKGIYIDSDNSIVKEIWNKGHFVTKIRTEKKKEDLSNSELLCQSIEDIELDENAQADIKMFDSKTQYLTSEQKKSMEDLAEKFEYNNTEKKSDIPSSMFGRFSAVKSKKYDSLSLYEYKEQLDSVIDILKEKDIKDWNIDEVIRFLARIEMDEYEKVFRENSITGRELLKITRNDLKSMGVVKGDQVVIVDAIEKLKEINNQEKRRKIFLRKNLIADTKVMSVEEKFLSYFDKNDDKLIEEVSDESIASQTSNINTNQNDSAKNVIYIDDMKTKKKMITNPMKMETGKMAKNKKGVFHSYKNEDDINGIKNKEESKKKHSLQETSDNILDLKGGKLNLAREKSNNTKLSKFEQMSNKKFDSRSSDDSDDLKNAKEFKQKKKNSKRKDYRQKNSIKSWSQYKISRSSLSIQEKIQEGAFGKVYLGEYIGQKVAIKVYKKHTNKKLHIESFLKEVDILNSLRHPNILLYMGICFDGDNYLMISEYLENGSLFDHLHRMDTFLEEDLIFQMIMSILRAMNYTHSKGVLHCDLKSSNILIDQNWNIKVADFGLSKKIINFNVEDERKGKVGTPNWMAPEICRGEKNTEASDVYSFGLIVWEMVTRKIPFEEYSYAQIMGLVGYSQKINLDIPSDCHPLLNYIMKSCIQFSKEDRPSFGKLLDHCDTYLENVKKIVLND